MNSAIVYKGDNVCDFLFAYLRTIWKGAYSQRKKNMLPGEKSLPFYRFPPWAYEMDFPSVVPISRNNRKLIGWADYRQLSIFFLFLFFFFFSQSIIWNYIFRNVGQRSHNETYILRVLWKTYWQETWLQNLLCLEATYISITLVMLLYSVAF